MSKIIWGILFIVIGLWIWLSNFGILRFQWHRDWPFIIVAIGTVTLIEGIASLIKRRRK